MTITFYELAGADDTVRFSPNTWRTRMALAHKGLAHETELCRFVEKEKIAFSGQKLVPVIRDGDAVVCDSWAIACYLEDTYPDRPSLFGCDVGRATTRFINVWTGTVLHGALSRLLLADIHAILHEMDKAYFRETREKRFGKTLEHNLQLLGAITELAEIGVPVLVGVSRKSMFGKLLDRPADERLAGGLAAAALAAWQGARIVRTHDVRATMDALKVTAAAQNA